MSESKNKPATSVNGRKHPFASTIGNGILIFITVVAVIVMGIAAIAFYQSGYLLQQWYLYATAFVTGVAALLKVLKDLCEEELPALEPKPSDKANKSDSEKPDSEKPYKDEHALEYRRLVIAYYAFSLAAAILVVLCLLMGISKLD